jgi:hypothetical protein
MAKKTDASIPHSWRPEDWPAGVFPGTPSRARYLLRCNRTDLIVAGALVRVGKNLCVIGDKYSRWLQAQTSAVAGFDIAPNLKHDPRPAA